MKENKSKCVQFFRTFPVFFSDLIMLDESRRLNSFLRKTRRGHVLKITQELYLRSDIPCGSQFCRECPMEPSIAVLDRQMNNGNALVPQGHYLVVDTNIVLQQVRRIEKSIEWKQIDPHSSSIYWKMIYSPMLLSHRRFWMKWERRKNEWLCLTHFP